MQLHLTAWKQCIWGVFPRSWPCRRKQEHPAPSASKNFSERWGPRWIPQNHHLSVLYSSSHKTVPCQGKTDQLLWHNCNKWGIGSSWFSDLSQDFPLIRGHSFRVTLTSIMRKPQMVFTAFRKALCLILAQPLCQYLRKLCCKADCCFCSNNICQYLLKEEEWQTVTNESLVNNARTFFSSPWSNPLGLLKIPRRETTSISWTQI